MGVTMETKCFNFDILTEDGPYSPRLDKLHTLVDVINGDAIIDEREKFDVVMDYPMAETFTLHIGNGPITLSQLARAVGVFYRTAFAEPEKYGIDPNDSLDRLYLEGADRRPDGTWRLLIGS
jgi:hypothetical protein